MSEHLLTTIEESGLSDAQPTPTSTNTSEVNLASQELAQDSHEPISLHTQGQQEPEEDDDDEPFVYPGSTETQEIVESRVETEQPAPAPVKVAERDPAKLEEIYAAAVSGDLHLLQTLFQSAVTSDSSPMEPFALANDATSRTGLTPLHGAASRGHLEVVQWLIECTGAIADMEDKEGETALHKAAMNGHLPVIQYLIISAGADLHAQDADGWTPLHNACSKGYLDIVRFLCNRDTSQGSVSPLSSTPGVDQKSKGGWTPLMNAASKGHLTVVLYLLSKQHADPFIRNNWGETAFDIAAATFEAWICEVLQKAEIERWSNPRINYNSLAVHTTIPLTLHENQRLDARLKTLAVSGGRPRFSTSGLGRRGRNAPFELRVPLGGEATERKEIPAWRSDVQLPLLDDPFSLPMPKSSRDGTSRADIGERSHFWLSDWTLDLTHPRVDVNEGWQYARSFEDPDEQWFAEPPPTLLRVLAGNGVLTPALTGASSSTSAQPMNISNGKQAVGHDNTTWVRRRRWIRVLRRRLDIPPLPFLQPDGLRYYLGAEGTLIPAEDGSYAVMSDGDGQEMGTFSSEMGGQDYVSRARYLAGTQRKGSISIGLLDANGAGVDGEVVSAADLKRAIGRLERATIELRSGMLGDEDNERKTQAEVLLNVYNRELERLRLSAGTRGIYLTSTVDNYSDPGDDNSSDSDESFHYPAASTSASTARPPSVRSHATSMDYFQYNYGIGNASATAGAGSSRAVDLTPQLSQAPEFRVPTHEAPQKVSTPRWTAPTPQSVQAVWERDENVQDCRNCRRRFTFWLRKHCRRCGKIFCDRCSSRQVILDPADVVRDPAYGDPLAILSNNHRVCDSCYEQVTANVPVQLRGVQTGSPLERIVVESASLLSIPRARQDSMSQISDLADCPVCGLSLADLGSPAMQEAHVKSCLDGPSGGPGANQAGKYLVYKLPPESTLIGVECVICLEEFVAGSDVARLSCFCTFHNACLSAWLQRGRSCPVHARDT